MERHAVSLDSSCLVAFAPSLSPRPSTDSSCFTFFPAETSSEISFPWLDTSEWPSVSASLLPFLSNLSHLDPPSLTLPRRSSFPPQLAPWDAIGGGRIQSKAQIEARKAQGEGLRSMLGGADQTPEEEQYSLVLDEIAQELGLKSPTAVALAYLLAKAPYVFPLVGGRKVEVSRSLLSLSFSVVLVRFGRRVEADPLCLSRSSSLSISTTTSPLSLSLSPPSRSRRSRVRSFLSASLPPDASPSFSLHLPFSPFLPRRPSKPTD